MPRSRGHDGLGLFADQVIHDGNIVRGKIPDHIHIMLEEPQIDPDGVKVVEIAKDVVFDQLLDLPDGAGIEEGMIHHDLQLLLLGQFDELFRLGNGVGKGFFNKDALAFLERLFGQFIVGEYRRGDGHGIDLRVFDQFVDSPW